MSFIKLKTFYCFFLLTVLVKVSPAVSHYAREHCAVMKQFLGASPGVLTQSSVIPVGTFKRPGINLQRAARLLVVMPSGKSSCFISLSCSESNI